MIRVVANNYIKQERMDEFLTTVKALVEKTNADDKGCRSYALYKDTQDPLHFTMLEEWDSEDAIKGHMSSPHFLELIPVIDDCSSKPANVTMYVKAVG
ncbi:MAG: antibiotic biosynthesis monooxygenase [Oscillospiraceae bacterium]|jgi:quinol monooxygenase YgiN|nr:antibiotic biosynthesis monooxygenase [Oscillospiraceae bacterium]